MYFQAFYFIIYFPSDSSLKCTSTAASSIEDGTISNWLTVESINRKKASKTVEPHVIMNWVSKSISRTFSTRNRNISSMDLYPFQSEKCVKILEMKHLNCRTPISWLFISLSQCLFVRVFEFVFVLHEMHVSRNPNLISIWFIYRGESRCFGLEWSKAAWLSKTKYQRFRINL